MEKYLTTELTPEYNTRKSFYGKAYINIYPMKKTLFSYGVEVISINSKGEVIDFPIEEDKLSQTTLSHTREFLKQTVDESKNWTKKEILDLKRNFLVSEKKA